MKNIIFIYFVFLAHISSAQTFITFSEAMTSANFSAFQPMADRGFSNMDEGVLQIRLGTKTIRDKWSFNGNLSYFMSSDRNGPDRKKAAFHGYGLSLGTQYHLHTWKGFKVQPSVELGLRNYFLDFIETITVFSSSFSSSYEEITVFSFDALGMYGDIGLGLERVYEMKRRNFGIGFEAGYRFDYGAWQLSDPITIQNANTNHNGIFAKINLLFALKRNKKE